MKIVKCPVTDSGVTLSNPKQGFIVQGNIYVAGVDEKGLPSGGLIGDGHCPDDVDGSKVTLTVMTKEEFLDALIFTPEEVEAWAKKRRNRESVVVMGPGEKFKSEEAVHYGVRLCRGCKHYDRKHALNCDVPLEERNGDGHPRMSHDFACEKYELERWVTDGQEAISTTPPR